MTYGFVPPPTCGKHDWWVAVIGATGDGSNDHRPVGQLIVSSFIMKGDGVVLLLGCNLEASKSNLCKCAHKDTLNPSFIHSTECSKAMVHSASYGHVEKKNERQVLDVWGFNTQSSDVCETCWRFMTLSSCDPAETHTWTGRGVSTHWWPIPTIQGPPWPRASLSIPTWSKSQETRQTFSFVKNGPEDLLKMILRTRVCKIWRKTG